MRHKENIYMIVTITLYYQVNNNRLMFVSRQLLMSIYLFDNVFVTCRVSIHLHI